MNPRRWYETLYSKTLSGTADTHPEALLAVILATPGQTAGEAKPAARELFALCGGDIRNLPEVHPYQVSAIRGVGPSRGAKVTAVGLLIFDALEAERQAHRARLDELTARIRALEAELSTLNPTLSAV